jgi:hypothetical protein
MIVPQNGCYMTRTIHANHVVGWGAGREWVRSDAFGPRIGFNPGADVF